MKPLKPLFLSLILIFSFTNLSPLLAQGKSEQLINDEKKYPLGYGSPEDIANATIFLLSKSSVWITGSSLIIDGGFSIQ